MRQIIARRYQPVFFTVFSLIFLMGVPIVAAARENSPRQAAALDTITVTANKMSENVQEVPQSITIIDKEVLEEKGIKSIADIIEQVPNLTSVKNYGAAEQVNFRGLNASAFTSKNPVIIYVDGVPISNQFVYEVSLANAKRVEILRGPQATIYGKDAIGGIINIITKEPRDEVSGSVGLEYSSYNTLDGKFNVSSPLIDEKFYFGLNARGYKTDGWVTNDYDGDKKAGEKDNLQLGGYLFARPTDRLSIKFYLSHDDKTERLLGLRILRGSNPLSLYNRKDAEHQNQEFKDKANTKIDSQSVNISYDFDNLRLSSVTTHQKSKYDYKADADNNYAPCQPFPAPCFNGLTQGMDMEIEEYTGELRLTNKDDKIKWVAGLYADREKVERLPAYYQMPFPNDPTNPSSGFTNMGMDSYDKQKATTAAVFGQVKFPLFDALNLTLGARLQRYKKEIKQDMFMYPVGMSKPDATPFGYETDKTWDSFLPKIAIDYKLNKHLTSYASVSTGYMPGGFNYFATNLKADPNTIKNNTFEPQKSTNYELGIKGVYGGFIRFSANVFRIDIKDIHVYQLINQQTITGNAEKAHSQGVEFDFTCWPTDEIEISGAFGFVDAKYDDYFDGSKQHKDERIEDTSRYTGVLGFGYYHDSGFYGRADGNFRGKTSFYDYGKNQVSSSGGVTLDVKLGYRIGDFDIYGYVKNVTNEEYIDYFIDAGILSKAGFNAPRTFGLGISYKF